MRHPLFEEGGLPIELIMSILILITPEDFISVSLVSKLWSSIMKMGKIRKQLEESWKLKYPSYLLHYEFNQLSRAVFHLINIQNTPSLCQQFNSVLDEKWVDDQHAFKLIDMHFGLICLKYWNRDLVTKITVCNPLTRRMRNVALPFDTEMLGKFFVLELLI